MGILDEPHITAQLSQCSIDIWMSVETLLGKIERQGLKGLKPDELLLLGDYYTELISDLNSLRTSKADPEAISYCNNLVLKAYSVIYRKKTKTFYDLLMFFVNDFPLLVRKKIHLIIASALIFFVAVVSGYICLSENSRLVDLIISPASRQLLERNIASIDVSRPPSRRSLIPVDMFFNSLFYGTIAFVGGVFFGLGTIFILIYSGLMIGGLASLYSTHGLGSYFWSLILPHGGILMIGVFILSAGGFMIGYALLNPGQYSRSEWVSSEGRDAIKLASGTVMLYIAGAFIETIITPLPIPTYMKFSFCVFVMGVFFSFVAFCGKEIKAEI